MASNRARGYLPAAVLLVLAAGVLACGELLPGSDPGSTLLESAPRTLSTSSAESGWQRADHPASRSAERVGGQRLHTPPPPDGHPVASGLNWAALAQCESGNDPDAVGADGYYGLYQVTAEAWHSVGGRGNPVRASAHEQTLRAQLLYERHGPEFWPVCGRYL